VIGQTISHYKIVEKLGEGGMGIVYKAQDTTLDRFVAIKFLPDHLSAMGENKSRFLQEAKAAAALNHPNILNVYEIDEKDGTMFLVMEYLEGQTLKDYLSGLTTGPGIPYRQALDWATLIAHGLKAAHDKNIVHRDIKPHNIMLTSNSQIKIMDFGLAKLKSGAGLTKTGTSLGTLSYMSPEQVQGIPTDAYAGLGETYASLYQDVERIEMWLDKALESSLKASMYDSTLPEAYAALGLAYYNKRMFEDAISASQRYIELDANNFLGYWILSRIYNSTDRFKEAIVLFNKVLSLNPDFYSVG